MTCQAVFGVFISCLLVGVLSYTWDPEELECLEELKLEKAMIEAINRPIKKPTPIDNDDLNNFLSCYWKKQGTQKENGEIDWDEINKRLRAAFETHSPEIIEMSMRLSSNAISKCRNEGFEGETHGQTIAKLQNCIGVKLREIQMYI